MGLGYNELVFRKKTKICTSSSLEFFALKASISSQQTFFFDRICQRRQSMIPYQGGVLILTGKPSLVLIQVTKL